jgi:hypothetical protein
MFFIAAGATLGVGHPIFPIPRVLLFGMNSEHVMCSSASFEDGDSSVLTSPLLKDGRRSSIMADKILAGICELWCAVTNWNRPSE